MAYILSQFPKPSETFASTDVRFLDEMGVRVSVYCLRSEHPDGSQLVANRNIGETAINHGSLMKYLTGFYRMVLEPIHTYRILGLILKANWRAPLHLLASLIFLPRIFDLREQIRADEPEVIHFFWGHWGVLLEHLLRMDKKPMPVISLFLGAFDLANPYRPAIWTAQRADVVWTHAKANVEMLEALSIPTSKILVSYRGFDTSSFSVNSDCGSKGLIVTASSLIPAKKVDDTLDIIQRVSQTHQVRGVILGDGKDRDRLEEIASKEISEAVVEFHGHVSHEEVLEILGRAHIFIFMSQKPGERLPNVVKEAMWAGAICIVSETPGIEELISHGETGFIVGQGDVKKATEHVRMVLNGEIDEEDMRERAREKIISEFDAESSMRKYIQEWSKLVDTGST